MRDGGGGEEGSSLCRSLSWGRLRDEGRGVRVKCQVWKGRGQPPWHTHTHMHTHIMDKERGSSAESSASYYPLNFSPRSLTPLSLAFSLSLSFFLSFSLCHSPTITLSISPPLHPNYWSHCKLDCCNQIAASPLQWKRRLFPPANFPVCVMEGRRRWGGRRVASSTVLKCFHQRLREALKLRLLPLYFKHSPFLSLSLWVLSPLSICFPLLLSVSVKILLLFLFSALSHSDLVVSVDFFHRNNIFCFCTLSVWYIKKEYTEIIKIHKERRYRDYLYISVQEDITRQLKAQTCIINYVPVAVFFCMAI